MATVLQTTNCHDDLQSIGKNTPVFVPKGKYLWDVWFIQDLKGVFHAFYLQADVCGDPEARHNKASIGHATSTDLCTWNEQSTALIPGQQGSWDSRALWTGSVVLRDGLYYMFYTGRENRADISNIQKIGVATSPDLFKWTKLNKNPVVEANSRWNKIDNSCNALGKIGAFRDPFVFYDEATKMFYMTISERNTNQAREFNACVSITSSSDLIHWTESKPLLAPYRYDEMECTQVISHKGLYYLFFNVISKDLYESTWAEEVGQHSGLHCYFADELYGEYKPVNGNGVVQGLGCADELYSVRLIEQINGGDDYTAVGWVHTDGEGIFVGGLSEPLTITIDGDQVFRQ